MLDLTSKTRERTITFDNITADSKWSLKYTNAPKFRTLKIRINIKLSLANPDMPILYISGEAWDGADKILFGQICLALLETSLRYDARFAQIAHIWLQYHLNSKTPGSPRQMLILHEALQRKTLTPEQFCSQEICFDYLHRLGISCDFDVIPPRIYGNQMTYQEIPANALNQINRILLGKEF